MIGRLLAAVRDRDGAFQRFGAPALAFVVTLVGAELLRSFAHRSADEWVEWQERSQKLVRMYGEARDSYWHVRTAIDAADSGSTDLPVPDFETSDQVVEALAVEADLPFGGTDPTDWATAEPPVGDDIDVRAEL